jgi:hypothetical protein
MLRGSIGLAHGACLSPREGWTRLAGGGGMAAALDPPAAPPPHDPDLSSCCGQAG